TSHAVATMPASTMTRSAAASRSRQVRSRTGHLPLVAARPAPGRARLATQPRGDVEAPDALAGAREQLAAGRGPAREAQQLGGRARVAAQRDEPRAAAAGAGV